MTEYVKDFCGRILLVYEHASNGDITVKEYPSFKVLGYYKKSMNATTDYTGRVLYYGNAIGVFLKK